MKILNSKAGEWKMFIKNNERDPYGAGVIKYTEKLADLAEEKILNGEKFEDFFEQCESDADTDGITGFMHDYAIRLLTLVWYYNEELKAYLLTR